MYTEFLFQRVQVPSEEINRIIPPISHRKTLENLPPLHEDAIRRVVNIDIDGSTILGYTVNDYKDNRCLSSQYFTRQKLDEM